MVREFNWLEKVAVNFNEAIKFHNLYESRGRQDGHESKIGCVPRKNSYGVTRNCEVPRNKQDELNRVAQTRTGLSISTKDLSKISSGPIICLTTPKGG
jgi:hypothetical protein